MTRRDEVAKILGELLALLARAPIHKKRLARRCATAKAAYADAIGALRILGLTKTDKDGLALTEFGKYIAANPGVVSAAQIVEAFNSPRGRGANGRSRVEEPWSPLLNSLPRRLPNIARHSSQSLQAIRTNAQRIVEKSGRPDVRFAMGVFIAAIDNEFERRLQSPHDEWFPWPETHAPGGDGSVANVDFMPEGMLSAVGYHVGNRNGLPLGERRLLLRNLFVGALPPLFPKSYMDKWGPKGSAHRLHTLADTIAAHTRNLKRHRDPRMEAAIRDYENDLLFLYETYYVGKFAFAWPSTALS